MGQFRQKKVSMLASFHLFFVLYCLHDGLLEYVFVCLGINSKLKEVLSSVDLIDLIQHKVGNAMAPDAIGTF